MERLRVLQSQLNDAYADAIVSRLSERAAVSMLLKLQEQSGLELLHSVDGREYLTKEYVDNKLMRELDSHGGRVTAVLLAEWLNVYVGVVEERLKYMVSRDRDLYFVQGEAITRTYLKSLVAELNALLEEKGKVSVAELVNRTLLPQKFLKDKLLKVHIEEDINGVQEGGFIYTEAYITSFESKIRGYFSSPTVPIKVDDACVELEALPALFQTTLNSLVAKGEIPGKVDGEGKHAVFTPFVYQISRNKWLKDFFYQNQFVELDALKRFNIKNPSQFMEELFEDELIGLSSLFVSPLILEEMEAALKGLTDAHPFLLVSKVIDLPMEEEDMFLLLNHSTLVSTSNRDRNSKDYKEYARKFALRASYIPSFLARFEPVAAEEVANASQSASAAADGEVVEESLPPVDKSTLSKKELRKLKKAKKASKENGAGSVSISSSASHLKTVKLKLKEWNSDFIEYPSLVDELAADLHPAVDLIYERLQKAVFVAAPQRPSADARGLLKAFQAKLTILYLNLQLFENGLDLLKNERTKKVLRNYLLSTLGQDVLAHVLENQALLALVPIEGVNLQDYKERRALIKQIPASSYRTSLVSLNEAVHSLNFPMFKETLGVLSESGGFILKSLSSKLSRTLQHNLVRDSVSVVKSNEMPVEAVGHLLGLIFIKVNNAAIYPDPTNPRLLLDELASSLSADVNEALSSLVSIAEYCLKQKQSEEALGTLKEELSAVSSWALHPRVDYTTYAHKEKPAGDL